MKVKIIDAGSVGARMNSILFVLHCRDKTIKILTALELGWNLWWAGYFYMDILLYPGQWPPSSPAQPRSEIGPNSEEFLSCVAWSGELDTDGRGK